MPTLFNVDHQHAILGPDGPVVAPGESHDFTDVELEAGVAGVWSETDPRAGLVEEKAFKKRRDSVAATDESQPADAGADKETSA